MKNLVLIGWVWDEDEEPSLPPSESCSWVEIKFFMFEELKELDVKMKKFFPLSPEFEGNPLSTLFPIYFSFLWSASAVWRVLWIVWSAMAAALFFMKNHFSAV